MSCQAGVGRNFRVEAADRIRQHEVHRRRQRDPQDHGPDAEERGASRPALRGRRRDVKRLGDRLVARHDYTFSCTVEPSSPAGRTSKMMINSANTYTSR